jgi:hypothetical protein
MNNLNFALQGGWKVLVAGLILGAGLPAVFAVGIRSLAWGTGGSAEVSLAKPHPAGRVVAAVCFGIVLIGIAVGISIVVASGFGKAVSFEHIYPTFVPKK